MRGEVQKDASATFVRDIRLSSVEALPSVSRIARDRGFFSILQAGQAVLEEKSQISANTLATLSIVLIDEQRLAETGLKL